MKLLLLISAIMIATVTNAQIKDDYFQMTAYPANQAATFSFEKYDSYKSVAFAKDEKHWKKLRTTGIVLTSFGAACVAGGIYFIVEDRRRNGAGSEGFGVAIGSAGIIGGATAIGGGIAMLTIGNRHLKKIRNASVSTSANGLGLALHF